MEEYLSRQPAPEERIEIGIAHLAAIYTNTHLKPGTPAVKISDFLPYLDAFKVKVDKTRYSDVDLSILQTLGAVAK